MRILAVPIILLMTPKIGMAESPQFETPIGTYKTVNVTTSGACSVLCEEDGAACRGSVTVQPDITQDIFECYLNDGLAEGSPFEVKPPEPLDMDIAVGDLNIYRAKFGLDPVRLNTKLNFASESHAKDMAKHGIISHTGTDGSTHSERTQANGYIFSIVAENVASGQNSWEKVFDAWQKSPGHNENLLRSDVSDFGISLIYERKTQHRYYWAMLLASPLEQHDN